MAACSACAAALLPPPPSLLHLLVTPPMLPCHTCRNGPGKFQVGSDKLGHPYDADGLILSIAFKDGGAYFRSRFVRTAE